MMTRMIQPPKDLLLGSVQTFLLPLINPAVGLVWRAAGFQVDIWVIALARISLQISLKDLCGSHTLDTAVT